MSKKIKLKINNKKLIKINYDLKKLPYWKQTIKIENFLKKYFYEKNKNKVKDLFILKSKNNHDSRGHLREIYNKKILNKKFVFDYSFSRKNTIKGLHLQTKNPQDKLIIIKVKF